MVPVNCLGNFLVVVEVGEEGIEDVIRERKGFKMHKWGVGDKNRISTLTAVNYFRDMLDGAVQEGNEGVRRDRKEGVGDA